MVKPMEGAPFSLCNHSSLVKNETVPLAFLSHFMGNGGNCLTNLELSSGQSVGKLGSLVSGIID